MESNGKSPTREHPIRVYARAEAIKAEQTARMTRACVHYWEEVLTIKDVERATGLTRATCRMMRDANAKQLEKDLYDAHRWGLLAQSTGPIIESCEFLR
jgi:uncharacterized protein YmfQ (DUF2313 family)